MQRETPRTERGYAGASLSQGTGGSEEVIKMKALLYIGRW